MNVNLEKEIGWLLNEKYASERTPAAEADIVRLKRGEPVAYVIGYVDFLGCTIDLSAQPLIPRPETEHWAGRAITALKARENPRVLDIFAGSGCIGTAVLKHTPSATVVFAERNVELLPQITENLRLNGVAPSRYRVVQSDLFSGVSGTFDAILANPPYVATGDPELQDSVRRWEPAEAVVSGETGLELIEPFLRIAPEHLTPGGELWLEFGAGQGSAVGAFLAEFGYTADRFPDQFGVERYAVAKLL